MNGQLKIIFFIKYIIYSCVYVIKVYYISSYMVNFGY